MSDRARACPILFAPRSGPRIIAGMTPETSRQRIDRLRREIEAGILAHPRPDPRGLTEVDGLAIGCLTEPIPPRAYLYEPGMCVSVSGVKHLLVDGKPFSYDPDHFLLTSFGLPAIVEVPGASRRRPYTGLQIRLDLDAAREVLAETGATLAGVAPAAPGFAVAPLSAELLDALARMVALLRRPHDAAVLGRLLHREILYLLLTGPAGPSLRQIIQTDSPAPRVTRALAWLRTHYREPCNVAHLAALCGMGVSTLHRHFQRLTTMSPIQYQKQLRLHEARRLMINDGVDAASAAFQVGYESATQFSREYRRLFGDAPKRDVSTIREHGVAAEPVV
ncbi:AraC family transcriptional regulator [Burkholderia plantarii]|uniref:AraC family transcriptional regulator n=1 Tax=Burkholderia plantarii TaxID=41899 RepID=UPI00272DA0E3|nr:AraC family transcriptional regulator [Burkholderia plantarii]